MNDKIATLLADLNRKFYDTFADVFAASRASTEPGLERVLCEVASGDRVLDLGCGQGRLAALLPAGTVYTGLDYSPEMLRIAATNAVDGGVKVQFVQADLTGETWDLALRTGYDWIILRAVLHHIPACDSRLAVLRRAKRLLAPGGRVVVANWQFMKIARLRQRVVPWSVLGLQDSDVETGDYLLDWQREGHGLRYVHLISEAEMHSLADAAGFTVVRLFYADGHTNDLTLYAVLERIAASGV